MFDLYYYVYLNGTIEMNCTFFKQSNMMVNDVKVVSLCISTHKQINLILHCHCGKYYVFNNCKTDVTFANNNFKNATLDDRFGKIHVA